MTSRRKLLQLAASLSILRPLFGKSHDEFWNSKDPAQWSDKEVEQMLTHSPWAKQTSVEMPSSGQTGMPDSGGMGRSGGGGGGMGGGMGGGGGRGRDPEGMGGGGGMPQIHALVRWESATPVSAAKKITALPNAADFYLLSVTGLKPRRREREGDATGDEKEREDQMQRGLLHAASLEVKGGDPISAKAIRKMDDSEGAPVWLYAFPRAANPITADAKEVAFVMHLGPMTLKAKFALKDMIYHDQLAL